MTLTSLWLDRPTHAGFWWFHRSGLATRDDRPEPVEVTFPVEGSPRFTVIYLASEHPDGDEEFAARPYAVRWLPMATPIAPAQEAA